MQIILGNICYVRKVQIYKWISFKASLLLEILLLLCHVYYACFVLSVAAPMNDYMIIGCVKPHKIIVQDHTKCTLTFS